MDAKNTFDATEIHQVLRQTGASIKASSEKLGWSSAFASLQRELPFGACFEANAHCLIVSTLRGPAEMTYRIDGRVVPRRVRKRGLFFLPAGQACDVTLHNMLDTIHLYLRQDLFRDPESDSADFGSGLAPILGGDDGVIESLLAAMEEMIRGDQAAGSSMLADCVASAIANRLIVMNYRNAKQTGPADQSRQLCRGQIRKIRDFIEVNLGDNIKLQELADLCGISTAHFIRLFKATLGVSPHQYVLGLRIGRAKTLLCERERSLTDVARACGFAHQQHFTRTFRRVTGVTPGAYRSG